MLAQAYRDYCRRIKEIHKELGIAEGYSHSCGLEIQPESDNLVDIEADVFGRQPQLDAGACQAWRKMRHSAQQEGIELRIISAYRSVAYQQNIFAKKITKGQCLEDILQVNAAPGYSEHHTGMALDIGCEGYEHLSEEFDKSSAFVWLSANADQFGFRLSFPKDNKHGVLYEPWHWKYSP